MIRRLLLTLAALLGVLAITVAINTVRKSSRQIAVPPAAPIAVDEAGVAERLAGAIRFRTVASRDDPDSGAAEFRGLHQHLRSRFPRMHAALKLETIGGYSLLYTWPGTDPAAKPMLLMAHQDVVPISPGTEPPQEASVGQDSVPVTSRMVAQWQVDPFAGRIDGGFVWGRGSWDDKGNLIAQMEAVETLLAGGFKPRRTVILVFGHDEEVGGRRGAMQIAQLLKDRKIALDFVLDEGLLITDGVMPGLATPAALVGIAEKGYLSLALKAPGTPGHSSMPPPAGTAAIGMLAAALQQLESRQMPAALRGVALDMFETIAPEMSGFSRVALSNLWLFGPVVRKQLEASASTNAMLRTTTALTVLKAGNADNVVPGQAEAVVNFRLLPGDSIDDVKRHVRERADERIAIEALPGAAEASRVSPMKSDSYRRIERTVRALFPDVIVAPGLMIAATDSRHFEGVADHIYRFSPVRAKPQDLPRFHGVNERIATSNLVELVRFYHLLITDAAGAPSS